MRRIVPIVALLSACEAEYGITIKPDPVGEVTETDEAEGLDVIETGVDTGDSGDGRVPEPTDPDPWAATEAIYAHTRDALFSFDATSGRVTRIGTFVAPGESFAAPNGMIDIAIGLDGRMFAGSQGQRGVGMALYQIDPTTADATFVCPLDTYVHALTFLADGRLVAGTGSDLVVVDVDGDCGLTTLHSDDDYETSGDVVGLPDGNLYWTVRGERGGDDDRLAIVDPQGVFPTAMRGSVGFERLYGLAYDAGTGTLFGFSADGVIAEIDPRTGTGRQAVSNSEAWWGATTNPVVWAP